MQKYIVFLTIIIGALSVICSKQVQARDKKVVVGDGIFVVFKKINYCHQSMEMYIHTANAKRKYTSKTLLFRLIYEAKKVILQKCRHVQNIKAYLVVSGRHLYFWVLYVSKNWKIEDYGGPLQRVNKFINRLPNIYSMFPKLQHGLKFFPPIDGIKETPEFQNLKAKATEIIGDKSLKRFRQFVHETYAGAPNAESAERQIEEILKSIAVVLPKTEDAHRRLFEKIKSDRARIFWKTELHNTISIKIV